MFYLFRRKDPVCGMKEKKHTGIVDTRTGTWLCSQACKEEFEKRKKEAIKAAGKPSCCK